MHTHDLSLWQHGHDFGTRSERRAEQRTRWVVGLTFATMLVELAAGWLTGSMALLADAWHMASHVGALGLTAFAYAYARRHAGDARYTFGTGKIGALAGYSSALLLGLVAFWMAWESFQRLLAPVPIHYTEAMAVATLGLVVNLASAWLLDDHEHPHGHAHGHNHAHSHDHDEDHAHYATLGHGAEHVDHNLRAAYLHVVADALTSVLAIIALGGGLLFGWRFLDPLMGLVGAAVVSRWAWHLGRDSAQVLLDAEDHGETASRVRALIKELPDHEVADLHVWRVGPASRACIVSVVSHAPRSAEDYRSLLARIPGLDHITVEVNRCAGQHCGAVPTA